MPVASFFALRLFLFIFYRHHVYSMPLASFSVDHYYDELLYMSTQHLLICFGSSLCIESSLPHPSGLFLTFFLPIWHLSWVSWLGYCICLPACYWLTSDKLLLTLSAMSIWLLAISVCSWLPFSILHSLLNIQGSPLNDDTCMLHTCCLLICLGQDHIMVLKSHKSCNKPHSNLSLTLSKSCDCLNIIKMAFSLSDWIAFVWTFVKHRSPLVLICWVNNFAFKKSMFNFNMLKNYCPWLFFSLSTLNPLVSPIPYLWSYYCTFKFPSFVLQMSVFVWFISVCLSSSLLYNI